MHLCILAHSALSGLHVAGSYSTQYCRGSADSCFSRGARLVACHHLKRRVNAHDICYLLRSSHVFIFGGLISAWFFLAAPEPQSLAPRIEWNSSYLRTPAEGLIPCQPDTHCSNNSITLCAKLRITCARGVLPCGQATAQRNLCHNVTWQAEIWLDMMFAVQCCSVLTVSTDR